MSFTVAQVAALALALFFYTVAVFGLAYTVGHSGISLPFRKLLAPEEEDRSKPWSYAVRMTLVVFLECPACSSFWYGAATGLVLWRLALAPWWFFAPLALYSCGASFILGKWTGLVQP